MSKLKMLKIEIETDPTSMGYSTMTNKEVADAMNRVDIDDDRGVVPAIEVLGAIDPADYPTGAKFQGYLQLLLSNESVPLSNPNIRSALKAIFAGKTGTISALKALEQRKVSRAAQIGLGFIKEGFVAAVRA